MARSGLVFKQENTTWFRIVLKPKLLHFPRSATFKIGIPTSTNCFFLFSGNLEALDNGDHDSPSDANH